MTQDSDPGQVEPRSTLDADGLAEAFERRLTRRDALRRGMGGLVAVGK